ncbi:MAG: transaldolase [Thermoleophilia bacterium]|nr:transaldolase [Thermoleophilia bacterium]
MPGAATNALARLAEFGQSVWCDDIGRDLLLAGRLLALIEEDGISGVTSNPTIFHKSIVGSSSYDEAVRLLASDGATAGEIMEALMVDDIRLAADQLRPVHLATGSRDGWVSIEVAPTLAYDIQGTVSEAMRIKALVDRPNVLVKVPATEEGVVAVRDLTGYGCSVNVTLIFSLERYRAVMDAYLSGLEALEARRAAGETVPLLGEVHGVASFFVSRLDTAVDKRLADRLDLRGKAAVASAKCAYRLFRETFSGVRWAALEVLGATVQRPLWASTSTKDPAYSDILYVQELIGPDTVNTMPLATVDAFRDHGVAAETITAGADEAAAHLAELRALGIDMYETAAGLERDGVRAFVDSHEALLAALEEKRHTYLTKGW